MKAMSPLSKINFKEWETEQLKDPEFVAEFNEPEPGYQITRLFIRRGLIQAQLAEMVGAREATIARLESGSSTPSLSLLRRNAEALDAKIALRLIAKDVKR
jgi:DNA-binding XRE family transcriptional regulator